MTATLSIKGTLLANNGQNCYYNGATAVTSQGYNLWDDNSCGFTQSTDQNNTPAQLDPKGLQNNGGPTQTVALLPTSPAVDAIPVSACTDANNQPIATDQRGITRPQGLKCDIGAFEYVEPVPLTFSSTKLDISGGTSPGFDLNAMFTLGATSNGIKPLTEAVTLQVGSYRVTIPAGSFQQSKNGAKQNSYVFQGTIQNVALQVQIVPLGSSTYDFKAEGSPVNFTGTANPVTVSITIGDDAGSTPVYAIF